MLRIVSDLAWQHGAEQRRINLAGLRTIMEALGAAQIEAEELPEPEPVDMSEEASGRAGDGGSWGEEV